MALTTLLTLLTIITTTLALPQSQLITPNTATVINKCTYPLYLWSIDQASMIPLPKIIEPYTSHSEPLRSSCPGCGVSLKVSKSIIPNPVLQFEYSVKDLVYYDISLIDCVQGGYAGNCPGHEAGLKAWSFVDGNVGGCKVLQCAPGADCSSQAYYVPVPGHIQPVKACGLGAGLVFEVCSG